MIFFKYHSNSLIVAHNFIISPESILTCYEGWNHYAMNLWIASNIQLKYSYVIINFFRMFNWIMEEGWLHIPRKWSKKKPTVATLLTKFLEKTNLNYFSTTPNASRLIFL
jgi:hypothetical protein